MNGRQPAMSAAVSREDVELLRLNTSERTVRRRVKAICDRLGFTTAIQAVAWAARQGLV